MASLKKMLCGITIALSLASLPFPQALAASSDSGDLTAEEHAELRSSAGITCDTTKNDNCTAGNIESGDYYNVRIYGSCINAAYYGRVNDKPVSLRKTVATTGADSKAGGGVAANQLVCIKAAAQVNATDMEYYIMALPMDYGPECPDEVLCKKPQPLAKEYQDTMANCKSDNQKGYIGCSQGWVMANEMEGYSNGLSFGK